MKELFLIGFIVVLGCLYCHSTPSVDSIKTPGILSVRLDLLDSISHNNKTFLPLYLYSQDYAIYDSLVYSIGEEPKFWKIIKPRAYYPQYYVLKFDCFSFDNGLYQVFFNDNFYYIEHIPGITEYLTWKQFILSIPFFDTTSENPLRVKPCLQAAQIDLDYVNHFFQAISVSDEWVYVNVFEGDNIFQSIAHGWLRWRDGNQLLLANLYFSI